MCVTGKHSLKTVKLWKAHKLNAEGTIVKFLISNKKHDKLEEWYVKMPQQVQISTGNGTIWHGVKFPSQY